MGVIVATGVPGWTREWPATGEHVAAARHAVAAFARRSGARERRIHDIALAVGEACANVVMHTGGDDDAGTLTVVVTRAEDRLEVVVRDRGRGMRARADSPGAGLGLSIIGQLADAVEIRPAPTGAGTDVRMRFAIAG